MVQAQGVRLQDVDFLLTLLLSLKLHVEVLTLEVMTQGFGGALDGIRISALIKTQQRLLVPSTM